MVLWLIAGLALALAMIALTSVRKANRRLESMKQQYWELRYDFTRLRSQVARIDPGDPGEPEEAPTPPASASQVTFVPLSSMKKKNG